MGVKRKAEHVHPSRQGQVPAQPSQKRLKPHTADGKPFKRKTHPINELKSQVRSLQRLLSKNEKLPADVRVEKERALQSAQHELEIATRGQARSDMIGRYHKIRFFDRQKANKRLKRARKDLAAFHESEEDSEQRAVLAMRVENAIVEVNYAQYYPLDRHYVSLFPRQKTGDDEDESDQGPGNPWEREREGDPEMWLQIKQCMNDGTLDALRNGKLLPMEPLHGSPQHNGFRANTKAKSSTASRGAISEAEPATNGDGDESDGGFFE